MCDGIICDGFIYKYLWADLAPHAHLAHFHYRGHGRSSLPADPNNIGVSDHAGDLNSVRQALGDPPVVLMGHSVGTQVILEAYRQRPEQVLGLVLLCGSYGRVTHTFKGTDTLAQALPRLIEFALDHPKLTRALWSRFPTQLAVKVAKLTGEVNGAALEEGDLEPYFRHLAHVDLGLFLRMLERAGDHSAEDILPRVGVPALVVAGDHDSFTPPSLSRHMAEQMPDAELMMLEGGTHVAPLEHPAEVAERIVALLARVGAGSESPAAGV
jgi:pimeloyl-ACP methyl ester carboxylesterase